MSGPWLTDRGTTKVYSEVRGDNKLTKPKRKKEMKKIMIAAAAVAMAGSVLAEGYTFTATLKTTTARAGTAVTETFNLGRNAAGEFWYRNALVNGINGNDAGIPAAFLKTHTVQGQVVPALRKTATAGGTVEEVTDRHPLFLLVADADKYAQVVTVVRQLADEYNLRSAGVYCDSVRIVNAGLCYRIAGTKRIDVKFREGDVMDCCDEEEGDAATIRNDSVVYDNTFSTGGVNPTVIAYTLHQTGSARTGRPEVSSTLYQVFGGQTRATARSAEIFARVASSVTTDGDIFAGWIAGQGQVFDAEDMAPRMLMGNIVGVLTAPVCPNCCTDPTPSVAFDCLNFVVPVPLPLTAAYGTFQMMYNAAL